VRDELAVGHGAQRVRDGALKRRAPFEVERDVTQLDAVAGEIRLKPRDELRHEVVTVRRLFPGYADSWDLASPRRGAARMRAGPRREAIQRRLKQMASERIELPCIIGGEDVFTGDTAPTVMPHRKDHVLADVHQGGPAEIERAIKGSTAAWNDWSRTPWEDRA